MCDLAAPLLVILDDEAEAYMCFKLLMERMSANFPIGGGAMDTHFANMRSLLQVLDHDLFSLIRQNGDYTHFYFCYRWFLLDFKRGQFQLWSHHTSQTHPTLYEPGLIIKICISWNRIFLSGCVSVSDFIQPTDGWI